MEYSNSQSDLSPQDASQEFDSIPKASQPEHTVQTPESPTLNPQKTYEEEYILAIERSLSLF
jgi:hypothetical protein